VATDTFDTTVRATTVEGKLDPENPRKVAAALGAVEAGMDSGELRNRLSLARPNRLTPFMFEHELIHRAKQCQS
jgi:phosphate acetyltransferase